MEKILKIVPVLIVSIFLAGCTGIGGRSATGAGIIVKEFSIEPSTIDSGIQNQQIVFTINLQNQGGRKAENIQVSLFGLSSSDFNYPSSVTISPNTLRPANPDQGLPEGEMGFGTAQITYVGGARANTLTFPLTVRVTYDYSTYVEGLVKIVSLQYYRQTKEKSGIQQLKYSAGPISVEAKAPSAAYGVGDAYIYLYLRNTGNGRPYLGDLNNLDMVSISGSGINCNPNQVRIPPGSPALVSCTISGLQAGQQYTTKSFRVEISYKYLYDIPATITVLKAVE